MTKMVKTFDTVEVGMKIRQLRKARSLRQDELSDVLGGLSRGQISNLETGKRNISLHQAKALANFFGVTLETLGLKTDEVEVNDLLTRAKVLFDNKNVPLKDKQDLYEEIMKLYISAKEQIKK